MSKIGTEYYTQNMDDPNVTSGDEFDPDSKTDIGNEYFQVNS